MHQPVLLKEVIDFLQPEKGKYFIDATVNGGGHAALLLERMGKDAVLLGIDRDASAIKKAEERFRTDKRFHAVVGNFSGIYDIGSRFAERFDGILFDLGFSSYHLEESGKGFSFLKDEPLDMRFDVTRGVTAEDIVNHWEKEKLAGILRTYGEERFANRIAHVINMERKKKVIRTTFDLVGVIKKAMPARYQRGRIHFATRTFQALRVAVNDELDAIEKGIEGAWKLIGTKGRIVMISFHSLEDRIVKTFFNNLSTPHKMPKWVMQEEELACYKTIAKKVKASSEEINENTRSRSAIMRCIERLR